jgi:hypothetical protein
MRRVQYNAKGIPKRAYPKWLVLHFAWRLLSQYIDSSDKEQHFRRAFERQNYEILSLLDKILDGIFKASDSFYRLEKGKGDKEKDISSFYLLSKLDEKFLKFWASTNNRHRESVEKGVARFASGLEGN